MSLGAPELLIILVLAVLLVGANRLPKLARSLGQASREFEAGVLDGALEDEVSPATSSRVEAAQEDAPSRRDAAGGSTNDRGEGDHDRPPRSI